MKQAAAHHVDIRISYKSQDPQLLEAIREEVGVPRPIENRNQHIYFHNGPQVLAQWPTLEEIYIDAWPITYYLMRALKHRGPWEGYRKHTAGRKSGSRHSQVCPDTLCIIHRSVNP